MEIEIESVAFLATRFSADIYRWIYIEPITQIPSLKYD